MKQREILGRPADKLSQASLPDFLNKKLRAYFVDRIESTWGGTHILHGRTPKDGAVMLMSNDYLSLANHPDVIQAQLDSLTDTNNTMLMSAVFLHGNGPQLDFERRMADWLQMEASILCQSGYAANVGVVQAIGMPDMPAYVDMFAHASLWEGVTAARMQPRPFRHNDPNHLEAQIKKHGRGLVLVDSIYSAHGSIARLEEIVAVATRHDCVMIVDESHSLGTHGPEGRGLVVQHGLESQVHFVTASLAKAFAGRAGIVACSEELQQYVKFHAFPNIFSSALLPQEIAGLDRTLSLIIDGDDRRERLRSHVAYLHDQLSELGYNIDCSESQIIPLESGLEPNTMILRNALEKRGVFGAVFYAPATAAKRSMVRLSVNAGLKEKELRHIVQVCSDIREEVDLHSWPSTRRKHMQLERAASSA